MTKPRTQHLLLLAFVLLFSPRFSAQEGEIQFALNPDAVDIQRIFVLPGTSKPCRGDELSAELVAQYAEVKLLLHYNILERKYLDMVLKEQQLGMSGLVYESEAVEAGCLQGSEGIVFCEVGCLVNQSMVKLKLIDCKESAQQWNAISVGSGLKELFTEVDEGIRTGRSREVDSNSLQTNPEGEKDKAEEASPGCEDESACNYLANPPAPCQYLDVVGVCGGMCSEDADEDGVCDLVDDCVGVKDACGRCNGPGAVYECGCTSIADGKCNCLGEELDAVGVCGGSCATDLDGDGVCDDDDDCVGELDECGRCNGPGAIYACGCNDVPEEDCDCEGNVFDALGVCGGGCWKDSNHDGVCDELEGCGHRDEVIYRGASYSVVTLAGQCWFDEDVRYLPFESHLEVWDVGKAHAYAVRDSLNEGRVLSVYYNQQAVQDWALCPVGWKVPADSDWLQLESNLGLSEDKLGQRGYRSWDSAQGTSMWEEFNPSCYGIRYGDGEIVDSGEGGGYWTSTTEGLSHAWYRLHSRKKTGLTRDYIYGRPTGFPVRCIRAD